jgi:hypothetical protein
MSKSFRTPPSRILGIEHDPLKAYFVDRGIWLFCSNLESDMDTRSDKAKNAKQSGVIRHQVLMEYLYPNDPGKRFRNPVVSSSKAESAIGGESYFTDNAAKRRSS